MKNTIQVHRNGDKKGPSSQARTVTTPQPEPGSKQGARSDNFALPDDNCLTSCLAIYDRKRKVPVSKVPITEQEFFDLCAAKTRLPFRGLTAGEIVAQAIREKLSGPKRSEWDLESAILKAMTLIDLLISKIAEEIAEDLDDDFATYHDFTGLRYISNDVKESLVAVLYTDSERTPKFPPLAGANRATEVAS